MADRFRVPAIGGSVLLLVIMFAWLGRWAPLVAIGWISSGILLLTRTGERIAVRAVCGMRRTKPPQLLAIDPVWRDALATCGIDPGSVDLYMQSLREPNAYAIGRRSVAITFGVVEESLAGRIGYSELHAVYVHELGHHAAGDARYSLVAWWLALPWRLVSLLVVRFLPGVRRCRRSWPVAFVALAVVIVASVRAAAAGQWSTAVTLTALLAAAIAAPLCDAAASRTNEWAADRYAADHGDGLALAAALQLWSDAPRAPVGTVRRLLHHRPATDAWIDVLMTRAKDGLRSALSTETGSARGGEP